jgi:hypothetical protein
MNGQNKLECLAQFDISSLVLHLRVRPAAYPSGYPLNGAPNGYAPALLTDIALSWKGLPGTNTLAYLAHS